MNAKNGDSASLPPFFFSFYSFSVKGALFLHGDRWGVRAATEACNCLGKQLPAYCNATLRLISYSFIKD